MKILTGGKPQRQIFDDWGWFNDHLNEMKVADPQRAEWSFIENMDVDGISYLRSRIMVWKTRNKGYNILTRTQKSGLKGKSTFFFIKVEI